ncbi:uncharacterized protein [Lolium perenne]|uniref:uncharacterized protein n=1 Tax=Lolium perenne TaxID=4522 RepID=UPI0021F5D9F3|nr:uncharacterized protein LOC127346768 [Lolium perenne]
MNCLSLNCRGLGADAAVGELRDLCRSYNPSVLFLYETKKRPKEMDNLKRSLGFPNGVSVDCDGTSGGLALWWKEGVEVSLRPWCQMYIDAKITYEGKTWRFTGIYGEPRTELRSRTWEALRYLRMQDDLPWLCVGDFNEILVATEQCGGNPRSHAQMETFRHSLEFCGLQDMGYKGYDFTWSNRRLGVDNIQVRLDRGTATSSFLDIYPLSSIEHICTEESDHMAVLVKLRADDVVSRPTVYRGFQFEEMWTKHEGYDDMIKET